MFLWIYQPKCDSKVAHVDNSLHQESILMLQVQPGKIDTKQTSVVDRAVFSMVWSCLTRVVDNFPRGSQGQTPPLLLRTNDSGGGHVCLCSL